MKYLIFSLLITFSFSLSAQLDPNFCGSHQGRSPWLKSFQERPVEEKKKFGDEETIFVPLAIHLVTKDNGNGLYSENSLAKTLCNLNDVFLESNLQFYLYGDILYEASSAMYEHSNTNTGGEYMLVHNIPDALNCYIVKDPAGNCGYNLPWAGIALGVGCNGDFDLTWAHEIGHALSLPHPFLGWEGGQTYDGTVPANFNNPAPEFVTYNYTEFKDMQYTDTLIIDTAYVELVDGSNCNIAADGFCDTKPDYLAFRWSCNNDGESNETQIDPNGVSFVSNGHVLMGYSSAQNKETNKCPGYFTEEQIQAMRANLLEVKADWLDHEFYELDGIYNDIVDASPTEAEVVDHQNAYISWELAEGEADKFIFQLGIENSVSIVLLDTIVDSPELVLFNLDLDKHYFWRVRAIDNNEFCSEFSDVYEFVAGEISSSKDIAQDQICRVFPSVLTTNQYVNVIFDQSNQHYNYSITNRNGQLVQQEKNITKSKIELDNYSVGLYFIHVYNSNGSQINKVIIE